MMKKFDIYYDEENKSVTLFYLSIIENALRDLGFDVAYFKSSISSKDSFGAVVIKYSDVEKAKKAGYKYVLLWIQGVAPEELFLSDRNIIKYLVRSFRECKALKKADWIVFCSNTMKKHYEKKYFVHCNKSFIMPCFNEEINKNTIINKDYSTNEFIYAGSLAKWQCFEKTVAIFKKIEDRCSNVFFSVYTSEKEAAESILKKYNVMNYSIEYVDSSKLSNRIQTAKFGFCIRDNITVNRVATPTKLSNYVSNGIIPIFSRCLDSFYNQSSNNPYVVCADDSSYLDQIALLCEKSSFNKELLEQFLKNYSLYYSKSYFIEELTNLLRKNKTLFEQND